MEEASKQMDTEQNPEKSNASAVGQISTKLKVLQVLTKLKVKPQVIQIISMKFNCVPGVKKAKKNFF